MKQYRGQIERGSFSSSHRQGAEADNNVQGRGVWHIRQGGRMCARRGGIAPGGTSRLQAQVCLPCKQPYWQQQACSACR